MNIIYARSYDKTLKNIKKHKEELKKLNEIIDYIENINIFSSMINDPLAKMYGFERLKYELNEFYSFRISKVIRLIVRPNQNDIEIELVYISTDHYRDFNESKVK